MILRKTRIFSELYVVFFIICAVGALLGKGIAKLIDKVIEWKST